ncbi:glycoside hydrolase family 76 protein [Pseudovirgaria hyperparasitica]|uniref:Mannan endo-1,6-alpha-mannosidase n=1 Tax=Pseudovirgaria hyperparasitica TaxID=470096 RepID=A0A6A6VX08_9PEZI|nr:glycoside hydrolase family 76 protein [Pseudovirgaria hyperparasitica]KAF2754753.1 glycoside hydrolase family 76 protein [Pseudovirgaria hyperparasitica]
MRSSWKSTAQALSASLVFGAAIAIDLDVNSEDSIRSAASTIAEGLSHYYKNGGSDVAADEVGVLPTPYYWWEAGAMWGGLVDYWAYTGDDAYVDNTRNALVAQSGPNRDLMNPKFFTSTGNDDQAFWALAMMSAVEQDFPSPPKDQPQYLDVAKAAFDTQVARWDTAGCSGGLRWQVFDYNPGWAYMNTISNGGFFQLAARLARYTGNNTYVEWAEKAWDWTEKVGLITDKCAVFDGTDSAKKCIDVNHLQWTYNVGIFMHGAATLYNYTNGSSLWEDRVNCMLSGSSIFFSPYENATDIMSEAGCEPIGTCNTDQQSFKAYLARWMAKTSVLAPFTKNAVSKLLQASAKAAARSCSGGSDGVTCGTKWYTDAWDGAYGVGQQLAALEVVQALLIGSAAVPRTQPQVDLEPTQSPEPVPVPSKTTSVEILQSSTAAPEPSSSDGAAAMSKSLQVPLAVAFVGGALGMVAL